MSSYDTLTWSSVTSEAIILFYFILFYFILFYFMQIHSEKPFFELQLLLSQCFHPSSKWFDNHMMNTDLCLCVLLGCETKQEMESERISAQPCLLICMSTISLSESRLFLWNIPE